MKTALTFIFFLLFFLCAPSPIRAQEDDGSGTPLAPKTMETLPRLETEEQVQKAMDRVKKINIRRYRSLKKFKDVNPQQFRLELAEFIQDNDPNVMRQQHRFLVQSAAKLRMELKATADKIREAQDPSQKKHLLEDLKKVAEKMISVNLEQQALGVKMKKQEAALLDTQLEAQKERKDETVTALVLQYTPKEAPNNMMPKEKAGPVFGAKKTP